MTPDFKPYGPEWEKELMKLPKKFLIEMIREANLEKQKLQEVIANNNPKS